MSPFVGWLWFFDNQLACSQELEALEFDCWRDRVVVLVVVERAMNKTQVAMLGAH